MEFSQLRTFVTLAGTRHFGRAAERLRIAQPHVSRRIKQLEEDLKVTLFHRDRKDVRLTLAGEALLPEAVKLLKLAEVARRRAVFGAQGKTGKLSISVVLAALLGPLPTILDDFHRLYPEISLHFVDNITPSAALLLALAEGSTDVVFAHPPIRLTGDFNHRTIVRDPLVAVLPSAHPLAGRKQLDLIDLADEPWIMFPREPNDKEIYDRIISLCHRAGFSPRILHEASNTLTRLGLVSAGFGVHLVHLAWNTMPFPGVVYLPVTPTDFIEIACYWRKDDRSPLLLRLLEVAAKFSLD